MIILNFNFKGAVSSNIYVDWVKGKMIPQT